MGSAGASFLLGDFMVRALAHTLSHPPLHLLTHSWLTREAPAQARSAALLQDTYVPCAYS